MTEQERLKAAEMKILERQKALGTGKGPLVQKEKVKHLHVDENNWWEKREKIYNVLKTKGMDSQQVEQAMAAIDSIFWGT